MQDRPAGQMSHTDAAPRLYLPSGHFCLKETRPKITWQNIKHEP